MPSLVELVAHAAMLTVVFAGIAYLRRAQPDPNPAIDAREAAKLAAAAMAAATGDASSLNAASVDVDRRAQDLPYVGVDRRLGELTNQAAAGRRSA